MSDNSFIREVNEELRQEKARALWGRYGPILIIGAVLLVLATGAFQIFNYWQDNKAGKIGDMLISTMDLTTNEKIEQALKDLDNVQKSDFGGYPILAQMRKAGILAQTGDAQQAVTLFDEVAANQNTPLIFKKIAKIRAAYILVDTGTYEDVEKRVKDMNTGFDSMRFSAREALGLAAYKAGKVDEAVAYFKQIVDEDNLSVGATARAQTMLEMIYSTGQAVKG